ncbi:MAG: hypothetical protein CMQ40_10895, partial [Gammaproteobacteria bacterium]|nr:hypothetical protein [Gammaproteobacteria bacterium]
MAQGKKTPNVPNESDMIQMKDAAVFFNVKPPAITQWKNSGRYRGFYNVNGKPKVYLPELIESRIANAISENQNGGGGDFEEELKAIEKEKARAAARKVIRSDQIEDGKTVYVDDIVMGFDDIASKFRSEIKAIGPHLAQQMIEYFSAFLLQAVD